MILRVTGARCTPAPPGQQTRTGLTFYARVVDILKNYVRLKLEKKKVIVTPGT